MEISNHKKVYEGTLGPNYLSLQAVCLWDSGYKNCMMQTLVWRSIVVGCGHPKSSSGGCWHVFRFFLCFGNGRIIGQTNGWTIGGTTGRIKGQTNLWITGRTNRCYRFSWSGYCCGLYVVGYILKY